MFVHKNLFSAKHIFDSFHTAKNYFDKNSFPSDTFGLRKGKTNDQVELVIGRIIDVVPYARCYKVQVEHINSAILCRDSGEGFSSYGPRQSHSYPPGTQVLVALHRQSREGFIISAVPDIRTLPVKSLNDCVFPGSAVGTRIDWVNGIPVFLQPGIPDFSHDRPYDVIGPEWNLTCETGLAIHLDPFMAFFRVDEATGLYLFYIDRLLRLAAHNYQFRSALSEREELLDLFEAHIWEGQASYPHESWGLLTTNPSGVQLVDGQIQPGSLTAANIEYDILTTQKLRPDLSRVEPCYPDQMPFYRREVFGGYLGGIRTEFIRVPSLLGVTTPPFYRYSDLSSPIGVHLDHTSEAGHRTIVSLGRATFGKTSILIPPKKIRRPEDPRGDNLSNYRFSGVVGSGAAHNQPTGIDVTNAPGGYDGLLRASCADDQVYFDTLWSALSSFRYHVNEWHVGTVMTQPTGAIFNQPTFTTLAGSQYLDPSGSVAVEISAKTGSVLFTPNQAFFHVTEDGGFVIADGYGVEIRASHGSLWISAPADIWLQSGRNLHHWGGSDVIIRARKNIDFSADTEDLRICTAKNLEICGGRSGEGGILIEARTAASYKSNYEKAGTEAKTAGVVILSRNSPLVAAGNQVLVTSNFARYGLSSDIYKSSPTASGSNGQFVGGDVTIDAGPGNLWQYGASHYRRSQFGIVDIFVDTDYNYINQYGPKGNVFGSSVAIDGQLYVSSCLAAGGPIITGDFFGTAGSKTSIYTVNSDSLDNANNLVSQWRSSIRNHVASQEVRHGGRVIIEEDSPDRYTTAEFTFRTPEQYGTDTGFLLYENRWQTIARRSNQSLSYWVTPACPRLLSRQETMPFPGVGVADNQNVYVQVDGPIVTYPSGAPSDLAGKYLYPVPTIKQVPLSKYLVIPT